MSHKRKHDSMENECYFPLGVRDIIRKIGGYLEGDHIIDYKLVCKEINKAMDSIKPEPMEITLENFRRTCMVPGYHFIRIGDDTSTLCTTIHFREWKPVVAHLIVDYCGKAPTLMTKPQEIISFFKLRSLKVIRSASYVVLDVPEEYSSLSTLEIYSAAYMTIILRRKIENVRLFSKDFKTDPYLTTIEIKTTKELIEYAKGIPYCANSRDVFELESGKSHGRNGSHKDFVPNSKFLM